MASTSEKEDTRKEQHNSNKVERISYEMRKQRTNGIYCRLNKIP